MLNPSLQKFFTLSAILIITMIIDLIGVKLFGEFFLNLSVFNLLFFTVFIIIVYILFIYFLPKYRNDNTFISVLSIFVLCCIMHLILREFNYFIIRIIQFLRFFTQLLMNLNKTYWLEAAKERAKFKIIISDFLDDDDNSFKARKAYFQKISDLNGKIEERKNHLKKKTLELV